MSYTPINWTTGDVITAAKLNKMDNGWSVSTATSTLCNESVTTADDDGLNVGQLSISSITASNISVTYDSATYQCAKDGDGGYGDDVNFTFSDYPFRIESDGFIITETSGTHSVKIEATATTVEASNDFQTAVKSVYNGDIFIATANQTTWQQIYDAMTAGKAVYVKDVGEDSVSMYTVSECGIDNNETYEVAALFIDGGQAAARYYYADSADSPIYAA